LNVKTSIRPTFARCHNVSHSFEAHVRGASTSLYKKLSCRRGCAMVVSLNISLSHSRLLKIIRN